MLLKKIFEKRKPSLPQADYDSELIGKEAQASLVSHHIQWLKIYSTADAQIVELLIEH